MYVPDRIAASRTPGYKVHQIFGYNLAKVITEFQAPEGISVHLDYKSAYQAYRFPGMKTKNCGVTRAYAWQLGAGRALLRQFTTKAHLMIETERLEKRGRKRKKSSKEHSAYERLVHDVSRSYRRLTKKRGLFGKTTKDRCVEFLREAIPDVPEGRRNDAMYAAICLMRYSGLSMKEAWELAQELRPLLPEGTHPYTEREMRDSWRSAYRRSELRNPLLYFIKVVGDVEKGKEKFFEVVRGRATEHDKENFARIKRAARFRKLPDLIRKAAEVGVDGLSEYEQKNVVALLWFAKACVSGLVFKKEVTALTEILKDPTADRIFCPLEQYMITGREAKRRVKLRERKAELEEAVRLCKRAVKYRKDVERRRAKREKSSKKILSEQVDGYPGRRVGGVQIAPTATRFVTDLGRLRRGWNFGGGVVTPESGFLCVGSDGSVSLAAVRELGTELGLCPQLYRWALEDVCSSLVWGVRVGRRAFSVAAGAQNGPEQGSPVVTVTLLDGTVTVVPRDEAAKFVHDVFTEAFEQTFETKHKPVFKKYVKERTERRVKQNRKNLEYLKKNNPAAFRKKMREIRLGENRKEYADGKAVWLREKRVTAHKAVNPDWKATAVDRWGKTAPRSLGVERERHLWEQEPYRSFLKQFEPKWDMKTKRLILRTDKPEAFKRFAEDEESEYVVGMNQIVSNYFSKNVLKTNEVRICLRVSEGQKEVRWDLVWTRSLRRRFEDRVTGETWEQDSDTGIWYRTDNGKERAEFVLKDRLNDLWFAEFESKGRELELIDSVIEELRALRERETGI